MAQDFFENSTSPWELGHLDLSIFDHVRPAGLNPRHDLELSHSVFASNATSSDRGPSGAPAPGKPDVWYWRVGLFAGGGSGICCAGVVCNIIAIIVLLNFRKRSSAPFLLVSLACLESLFLLSYLFLENIALLSWGGLIPATYAVNMKTPYSLLYPLPHILQTCLAYLVVVITLERYTVVAWPFKARTLCSLKSARIAVACVLVYAVLYHIPTYSAFTMGDIWNNSTGTWEKDFIRTEFGNSHFYNVIFIKHMHLIFNFGIPSALLLVLNTLLVLALRRSAFSSSADQTRAARETRLTVMVFSLTVIFFVVHLMEAIALGMLAGLSEYQQAPVPVNRFSAVADTLMLLNSATNFVIYCATGRQFRETFVKLFCRYPCRFRSAASGEARQQQQQQQQHDSVAPSGREHRHLRGDADPAPADIKKKKTQHRPERSAALQRTSGAQAMGSTGTMTTCLTTTSSRQVTLQTS